MQGHVDQSELEIDEIGFAGQRADRREVRGSKGGGGRAAT